MPWQPSLAVAFLWFGIAFGVGVFMYYFGVGELVYYFAQLRDLFTGPTLSFCPTPPRCVLVITLVTVIVACCVSFRLPGAWLLVCGLVALTCVYAELPYDPSSSDSLHPDYLLVISLIFAYTPSWFPSLVPSWHPTILSVVAYVCSILGIVAVFQLYDFSPFIASVWSHAWAYLASWLNSVFIYLVWIVVLVFFILLPFGFFRFIGDIWSDIGKRLKEWRDGTNWTYRTGTRPRTRPAARAKTSTANIENMDSGQKSTRAQELIGELTMLVGALPDEDKKERLRVLLHEYLLLQTSLRNADDDQLGTFSLSARYRYGSNYFQDLMG